ncbi:MAG: sensor histidine kinase [Bacteroidota bacterium]
MILLKDIIGFFRLKESERDILRKEIATENIRRVFYLSIIAVPVSLTQIIIFWLKLPEATGTEYHWRMGIIYSHAVISISFLFLSLLLFFASRKNLHSLLIKVGTNTVILILLIAGSVIVGIDQQVTTSITPFLITSLITAFVLLIRPFISLIYYSLSYIIFYFVMAAAQADEAVMISNQVNGITASAVGLLMSFILWNNFLTRRKQQRLIERQNEELREANISRDKFFSIIAHDLKSPMSTILGFMEVMDMTLEAGDVKKTREMLKIADNSTRQTLTLLENLLMWSRSQSGRLNSNPDKIFLGSLIRDRINNLSGQLLAKNLTVDLHSDDSHVGYADPEMIKTVMRNLLSNAIKFSFPGHRIEVKTVPAENMIVISVSDTGTGISPEKMDRLFNLATTPLSEGTAHEQGTGLGLILCKEMIEKQGGQISLESQEGKGTTVRFTVPQALSD